MINPFWYAANRWRTMTDRSIFDVFLKMVVIFGKLEMSKVFCLLEEEMFEKERLLNMLQVLWMKSAFLGRDKGSYIVIHSISIYLGWHYTYIKVNIDGSVVDLGVECLHKQTIRQDYIQENLSMKLSFMYIINSIRWLHQTNTSKSIIYWCLSIGFHGLEPKNKHCVKEGTGQRPSMTFGGTHHVEKKTVCQCM